MNIKVETEPSVWRDKKQHIKVKLSLDDVERIVRNFLRNKGVPIPKEQDLVWNSNEFFHWEFGESDCCCNPSIYNLNYSFDI